MEQSASEQIELNKKYGGRLIAVAWAIEIVAASIGLFIGINTATSSIEYYTDLESSSGLVGDTFTNVFIGAAPFIIIAAVELTKIPLVLGFYRTRDLGYRLLFLLTLLTLIFVTFETMFNGLERSFTATEDKVSKPKRALIVQQNLLDDIDLRINEINSRTSEDIDQEYAEKINQELNDRKISLGQDSVKYQENKAFYEERLKNLSEQTTLIANVGGLNQKTERLREDLENLEKVYRDDLEKVNNGHEDYLIEVNGRLQTIDAEESDAIENKGFLASTQNIIDRFNEKRNVFLIERKDRENKFQQDIARLEQRFQTDKKDLLKSLQTAEQSLQASEANSSGMLSNNFKQLNGQLTILASEYARTQSAIVATSDERIQALNQQKQGIMDIQKQREIEIPQLEIDKMEVRKQILDLEETINAAARGNQIYRITQMFFGHDNASKVTKDELKIVAYTWFGSIAFIAASVGAILALAGFILQDPDSYRKKPKPIFDGFRALLSSYFTSLKHRRVGVIRNSLRAMMISIRRFARRPRIKYVEVKVPETIEKQIPGPERVVVKEVPKEIIRKELVYVPLYSVEEGTVKKQGDEIE
ncbi:MAG: hypothetical protein CMK41_01805 [Porticoccaceae bacterium]|nr:hypothetical protein [Porticoccaceae bacterium]